MVSTTFDHAESRPAEQVDYRRLLWVAPAAAVLAAVANAIVFLIADALGAFPAGVLVGNGQELSVGAVSTLSFVGVLIGGVIYALLGWLGGRFTRRPIRLFTIIAIVFTVIYAAAPFSISGAGAGYILALELMHIVAAVIAIGMLTTLARKV